MSQLIVSRYGATLDSENAAHAERMIQQRASRDGVNCAFGDSDRS